MAGDQGSFASRLTMRNPSLGIADDQGGSATRRSDGSVLSTYANGIGQLDYLRYGTWARGAYDNATDIWYQQSAAGWVAGYVTAPDAIPVRGTAAYSGDVVLFGGAYFPACQCLDALGGRGKFSLVADFADRSLQSKMTELALIDSFPFKYTIGDVSFSARFASGQNLFTGWTQIAGREGPSGDITGRFFGPDAGEIGAVFTLNNSPASAPFVNRVFGAFGGKRN